MLDVAGGYVVIVAVVIIIIIIIYLVFTNYLIGSQVYYFVLHALFYLPHQ